MRSVVLILVPLALLAGLFYFVVVRGRPAPPMDALAIEAAAGPTTRKVVPTTVSTLSSDSVLGNSDNVWMQSRNKKTREVTNEFRAQRFDPRKDGAIDVTALQARFYGESGGIVTLEGTRGQISVSQPGEHSDPNALGQASPTEGVLEDVTIRFFDASLDDEPSIICTMPKVHFDAIGNRVNTVDCVIDGKGVLAEQVPVTVRGRDFEFDGFGLAMNWNDRDSRLDSLEINKGQRLLIKDPDRFGLQSATQPAADVSIGYFLPTDLFLGAVTATPATTPVPRKAQLYHATFDHEVRVMRDGVQMAAGDVMRVVLPMGEERPQRAEPPPPIESDRARREKKKAASTRPIAELAQPMNTDPPAPTVAPAKKPPVRREAATSPTTTPASPIEVFWNGPLTVRPVEKVAGSARNKMVELVGAPAWFEQNGSRANARLIHAEPDSGRYRLEPGGPVKAIAVHDAGGAELRSHDALFIDRTAGVANVNGGGTLTTPGTPTQPDPTTVTWSRRMTLGMATGDASWIKHVLIEGEANVENKQLKVNSDTLALGFDPPRVTATAPSTTPSTKPARSAANMSLPSADMESLRTVVATGGARMEIGADDTKRTLAATKINLGFVAGTPGNAALETVRCAENVALDDAKGFSLACANLDAKLKPTDLQHPTTQSSDADPLAGVDRLLATGDVSVKQADGSTGTGERLQLEGQDDAKRMTLTGAPARAASPRGALEGDRIHFSPASGDVDVPGPGRFVDNGDATRPDSTMAIAWLDSMKSNTKSGICDLLGGVHVDGTNPDGTHLTATAANGRVLFSTTRPTTKPATEASTAPTSKPTSKPAAGMSSLSVSSIQSVHLSGDVDVAMEAYQVRTSSLQSDQLDIDLDKGTVVAPVPGRVLILDGRPQATTRPTTRSSTEPTTEASTEPVVVAAPMPASEPTSKPTSKPTSNPSSRGQGGLDDGSLAIAWKNQMVWQMHEGVLTFDGGVRMGYERTGTNDPIRIDCEQVVCGLTPVQTGNGMTQMSQKIEMQTMTAEKNVSVRSKLASFDATTLRFDTTNGRATAVGDVDTPVEVFDADGSSRVGFSSITWSYETGLIEDFSNIEGRFQR